VPAREIRCLVTGATGYIGGRLVPRLLEQGYKVRALARSPEKLSDVPWRDDAELVRGDLRDLESLTAAFDGVDVVYYLVHSMGTSKDFAAEEGASANNVVTAARRAGVRRLVYLSGLHPPDTDLSPHLQSRKAVGDILIGSGIETLVLQAGVVVGSGSASFEMIRHLADRLPVMTTPKWVHNKIQPIAVRDVLHYLVAAATADVRSSRTWDTGGPDVLEYGDMMRIYADVAGLGKRYLIVLPFLTPTIASLWVGTVTPIPPGLARPLIGSLECDAVMRDHDIDTIIARPAGGLTHYRRAVALALHRAARGLTDSTWASLKAAPSEPLPSDPDWAGEIGQTDERSASSHAEADELWKVVETTPNAGRWYSFPVGWRPRRGEERCSVEELEPGSLLRLHAEVRAPGEAWLEMRVSPDNGGGSRYDQRAVFFPRGIPGRLYWYVTRPVHALALRAMARKVTEAAG
jgi:uncharacterized protein YbjT (DUF2867 family)